MKFVKKNAVINNVKRLEKNKEYTNNKFTIIQRFWNFAN